MPKCGAGQSGGWLFSKNIFSKDLVACRPFFPGNESRKTRMQIRGSVKDPANNQKPQSPIESTYKRSFACPHYTWTDGFPALA